MNGFWEYSQTDGNTLEIIGWGYGENENISWVLTDGTNRCYPKSQDFFERRDVMNTFPNAPLQSGIRLRFSINDIIKIQRRDSYLTIEGHDQKKRFVCPHSKNDTTWRAISFSNYIEFSERIQNPAFREKDPKVLVFASKIALLDNRFDIITKAAAMVVLLYRIILSEISVDIIDMDILDKSNSILLELKLSKSPISYRWNISLLLALAYYFILNEKFDDAEIILKEICELHIFLDHWPAMATNVVTSYLIRFILRPTNEHLIELKKTQEIMKKSICAAPIENYFQFEEHINLIKVTQQASVLFANFSSLENWVGPTEAKIEVLTHIPRNIRTILSGLMAKIHI